MRKTGLMLSVILFTATAFSQSLTDYKYVVVPAKFSFFKQANKYNLNALTKMVFERKGYTVLYDTDVVPDDLARDRCKALYANLVEDNTVFSTKIKLELTDCKNQTVFISNEGSSRIKELEQAYIQAFRVVGKSVEETLQVAKPIPTPSIPPTTSVVKTTPATPNNPETVKAPEVPPTPISGQLFAQPITNGYQLVDSTPKIVLKIFKTSNPELFTAKNDTAEGVLIKKNNGWVFEYYYNDKLVSEKLDIKF
ncbi:hypothetical protein [Flavobacterium cerinum]|uniref:Uncharacterized protein n=1 Tax=Flavobacterium cerinum TaxID=2502784 RepID=A0ABY5J068_9FLAO|nr:hypothetical protein [Flavobacterium cerinum]UUC46954.1 hypothetical protein NOX80_07075 [Flavobacterium cerinum]